MKVVVTSRTDISVVIESGYLHVAQARVSCSRPVYPSRELGIPVCAPHTRQKYRH